MKNDQKKIQLNMLKLIEKHGLTPCKIPVSAFWGLRDCQHIRIFRTGGKGVMVVVSNYKALPPLALGMEPALPMFAPNFKSYIRIFSSVAAMEAVIKRAEAQQGEIGRAVRWAAKLLLSTIEKEIAAGKAQGRFI